MRRSQRTFKPDDEDDPHTCIFSILNILYHAKIRSKSQRPVWQRKRSEIGPAVKFWADDATAQTGGRSLNVRSQHQTQFHC